MSAWRSVDEEAIRLLDRHDRAVAARVADGYAQRSFDSGSEDRSRFWNNVALVLRGRDTIAAIRERAARAVSDRPRDVTRARRRELLARLSSTSTPNTVVAALTKLPTSDLYAVVDWLCSGQGRSIEFEPIPDYADLLTREQFASSCASGGFTDSDGGGNLATATQMSDVAASTTNPQSAPAWATHVVWFNK